jgi:hypothetical protein
VRASGVASDSQKTDTAIAFAAQGLHPSFKIFNSGSVSKGK